MTPHYPSRPPQDPNTYFASSSTNARAPRSPRERYEYRGNEPPTRPSRDWPREREEERYPNPRARSPEKRQTPYGNQNSNRAYVPRGGQSPGRRGVEGEDRRSSDGAIVSAKRRKLDDEPSGGMAGKGKGKETHGDLMAALEGFATAIQHTLLSKTSHSLSQSHLKRLESLLPPNHNPNPDLHPDPSPNPYSTQLITPTTTLIPNPNPYQPPTIPYPSSAFFPPNSIPTPRPADHPNVMTARLNLETCERNVQSAFEELKDRLKGVLGLMLDMQGVGEGENEGGSGSTLEGKENVVDDVKNEIRDLRDMLRDLERDGRVLKDGLDSVRLATSHPSRLGLPPPPNDLPPALPRVGGDDGSGRREKTRGILNDVLRRLGVVENLGDRVDELEMVVEGEIGRGLGVEASWEGLLRGRKRGRRQMENKGGGREEEVGAEVGVGKNVGVGEEDDWEVFERARNLGQRVLDQGEAAEIDVEDQDRRVKALEEQVEVLQRDMLAYRQDKGQEGVATGMDESKGSHSLQEEVRALKAEMEGFKTGVEKNNRDAIQACMNGMKEEYEGIVKKEMQKFITRISQTRQSTFTPPTTNNAISPATSPALFKNLPLPIPTERRDSNDLTSGAPTRLLPPSPNPAQPNRHQHPTFIDVVPRSAHSVTPVQPQASPVYGQSQINPSPTFANQQRHSDMLPILELRVPQNDNAGNQPSPQPIAAPIPNTRAAQISPNPTQSTSSSSSSHPTQTYRHPQTQTGSNSSHSYTPHLAQHAASWGLANQQVNPLIAAFMNSNETERKDLIARYTKDTKTVAVDGGSGVRENDPRVVGENQGQPLLSRLGTPGQGVAQKGGVKVDAAQGNGGNLPLLSRSSGNAQAGGMGSLAERMGRSGSAGGTGNKQSEEGEIDEGRFI